MCFEDNSRDFFNCFLGRVGLVICRVFVFLIGGCIFVIRVEVEFGCFFVLRFFIFVLVVFGIVVWE